MDATTLPDDREQRNRKAIVASFKARDSWVRAVLADARLTPLARLVAVRLAFFLNTTTGRCDPGYDALAAAVGAKPRATINAVAILERIGWVEIERSRGRHSNHYRLTVPEGRRKVQTVHGDAEFTVHTDAEFNPPNSAPACTQTLHADASELCAAMHPNSEENCEEKISKSSRANALDTRGSKKHDQKRGKTATRFTEQQIEILFADFWSQYPKQVGRYVSLKAYSRIVQSGEATPEQLSDSLSGYQGERHWAVEKEGRRAHRYTLNPTTWLEEKRWLDDCEYVAPEVLGKQPIPLRVDYLLRRGREDEARATCGERAIDEYRDATLWRPLTEAAKAYRAAFTRMRIASLSVQP